MSGFFRWLGFVLAASASVSPAAGQVVFEFRVDAATAPHADHTPYIARIGIVSSAVVTSGQATLAEVDFLVVRAGSQILRLRDLHSANTGHTIRFSADGNGIVGFAQVGGAGDPNTWLIAQSVPSASNDVDNVVHLGHDRIRHETMFSQPGNTAFSNSDLAGRWVRQRCLWPFRWPWWWIVLIPAAVLLGYLVMARLRKG
jgi:hypothetical protein